MRSKNWITEFCLTEQKFLENVEKISDLDEDILMKKFRSFVQNKNPDFDMSMGDKELSDLKNFIKYASISKNLWNNDSYFKVLSEKDNYIQKSIRDFKLK